MTPAFAAAIVDDVIARKLDGDYFPILREEAVEAVLDGRPAVITTGSYHNQFALNVCQRVNADGVGLVEAIETLAATQKRDVHSVAMGTLLNLVGANEKGKRAVEAAKFLFLAPMRSAAE